MCEKIIFWSFFWKKSSKINFFDTKKCFWPKKVLTRKKRVKMASKSDFWHQKCVKKPFRAKNAKNGQKWAQNRAPKKGGLKTNIHWKTREMTPQKKVDFWSFFGSKTAFFLKSVKNSVFGCKKWKKGWNPGKVKNDKNKAWKKHHFFAFRTFRKKRHFYPTPLRPGGSFP